MCVGKLQSFNPSVDDWDSWVKVLENFLLANGVDKAKDKEAARCVAILLSTVSVSTYTLLKYLSSHAAPETLEFAEIVTILRNHFKPAPKAIAERFKFFSRKQQAGESVTMFMSELRHLAVTCKFEKLEISLRDQFVFGLSSEAAQKRLFLEDDSLSLRKALSIATSQEAADASTLLVRISVVSQESTNKVHVHKLPGKRQSKSHALSCPNCGNRHEKSSCPHGNVVCHKCNRKGHFARFCKSGGAKESSQSRGSVKTVKQVNICDGPITVSVRVNNKNS